MRRLMVTVLLAVALGAAGCSSSGSGAGSKAPSTSARTGNTSLAGAKTAAEQQAAAENNQNTAIAARCVTDLRSIQTAIAAYTAVNGGPPSSVAALAPDFLKEAPTEWQLGPAGADGGPTVVPNQVGVAAGCRADGTAGG